MRSLEELLEKNDPAILQIRLWWEATGKHCEILPPSEARGEVLRNLQVTTRSTVGAIAYETGGMLVDQGWLRFLGSGHTSLPRSLTDWNRGRAEGFLLVADDAVGGFFALNGGALGGSLKNVHYWPPDSLDWEDLGFGFTDFLQWSLSSRLADFYAELRWPTWREEAAQLAGDRCFVFYPYLWTREGSLASSSRRPVPVVEAFDAKADVLRQLQRPTARS